MRPLSTVVTLILLCLTACGGQAPPPARASEAPAVRLAFPSTCARGSDDAFESSVTFVTAATEVDGEEILFRYQQEYGVPSTTQELAEVAPDASADVILTQLAYANLGFAAVVTDRPFEGGDHWRRDGSVGVVSMAGLHVPDNPAAAYTRLFKLITRVLGEAYCGFEPNQQPRSIMFEGLRTAADIDRADESVW